MRDTPAGVGEQKIGATWIGGGPYTGLKTAADPSLHVLNRRAHVTGMVRGISPEHPRACSSSRPWPIPQRSQSPAPMGEGEWHMDHEPRRGAPRR
jgi:hypothetical protein